MLAESDAKTQQKDRAIVAVLGKSFIDTWEQKLAAVLEPYFNPAVMLAGLLSATGGRTVAQHLVSLGQKQCLAKAAEGIGLDAKSAKQAATAEGYDGPFLAFVDAAKWSSVCTAAKTATEDVFGSNATSEMLEFQTFLLCSFAAATLTQDPIEGVLKIVKNLDPRQRGFIETVNRQVRGQHNRRHCLVALSAFAFPFQRKCLWPCDEQRSAVLAKPLRLTFSEGNPDHPALPQMTSLERTAINTRLGFNSKPSASEREAKRTHVETVVPDRTHAAVIDSLRIDFAVAALPAEPSLEHSSRRKRKAASKPKAKRKTKRKCGKDEVDVDVEMEAV